MDVEARRRPAHVARHIGANLLDDGPLGTRNHVAVHRLEGAYDLVDFEWTAERRRVGHAACRDQVFDERHGPVADREVRRGFLRGERCAGEKQEQGNGCSHGGGNLTRKCKRGTRNSKAGYILQPCLSRINAAPLSYPGTSYKSPAVARAGG